MPPGSERGRDACIVGGLEPGAAAVLVEAVAQVRARVPGVPVALQAARRASCAASVRKCTAGGSSARPR